MGGSAEIGVVVEDRDPYPADVAGLFSSLRLRGGRLADAPARVHVAGASSEAIRGAVDHPEVEICLAPRFDPRCPHANKLAMLDGVERQYLVALDSDVLVVRDFSDFLVGESVGAKVANRCPISLRDWEAIFEVLGVALPNARTLTCCDWQETIPYFNSGVLIVPRSLTAPLRDAWGHFVVALLDAMDRLPETVRSQAFFTDQLALTVAVFAAAIPYRELPVAINFSRGNALAPPLDPDRIEPYLVHHHHLPDDAFDHRGLAAQLSGLRDELGLYSTPTQARSSADLSTASVNDTARTPSTRVGSPSAARSPRTAA